MRNLDWDADDKNIVMDLEIFQALCHVVEAGLKAEDDIYTQKGESMSDEMYDKISELSEMMNEISENSYEDYVKIGA